MKKFVLLFLVSSLFSHEIIFNERDGLGYFHQLETGKIGVSGKLAFQDFDYMVNPENVHLRGERVTTGYTSIIYQHHFKHFYLESIGQTFSTYEGHVAKIFGFNGFFNIGMDIKITDNIDFDLSTGPEFNFQYYGIHKVNEKTSSFSWKLLSTPRLGFSYKF